MNVETFENRLTLSSSRKRSNDDHVNISSKKLELSKHNSTTRSVGNPQVINIKHEYKYAPSDLPSFVVHVHAEGDKSLYLLHMNKLLFQIAHNDIIEVHKISKGNVMAEMYSAHTVNNLIKNPLLSTYNLKAFIPSFRTNRSGIIKDIPLD